MRSPAAEHARAASPVVPGGSETVPLRVEAAVAGGLVLATYVVLGFLRPYAAGTLDDDGVYITVGKALATGQGYRNIHLVGEPPNTNYPPGVPLLFALVWKLAGSLSAVQQVIAVLNLIACSVAAGVLWFIARARLQLSRIVTFLFVIAPLLLDISFQHYQLALSEPYFLLGWALVLLLYYQVRDTRDERRAHAFAALLGFSLLLVASVRLQAIGLIPAVLIALALERRRVSVVAAALAGLALPIMTLLLAGGLLGVAARLGSAPHFSWLSAGGAIESIGFAMRAAGTNFMLYQIRLTHYLSGAPGLGATLLIMAAVLVLAGIIYLLRRHAALALTVVATIAVVLIWPFNDLRLVVVIMPFAGMAAAPGVDLLLSTGSRRRRNIMLVLLALLALPMVVRQLQFRSYARPPAGTVAAPGAHSIALALQRHSDMIVTTADWVLAHTRPQDRVMVAHTAGIHLRTGRKAVESNPPQSLFRDVGPSPFARPARFLASMILSEHVNVLVLEQPLLRVGADAQIIRRVCPNVLQSWEGERAGEYPLHYRVTRDEPCLRSILEDASRE